MFSFASVKVPREQLRLRVLNTEDLGLLQRMEQLETLCHRNPWDERSCRECFSESYKICAVFLSSKLIGYAVIYATRGTTDLLTIGIDPKYQGRGLGALLLEFTLQEAVAQGADECFLEVRVSNLKALGLYHKFGFVKVGVRKGYYTASAGQEAEDAYTMVNSALKETLSCSLA
ncbi:MAG: ribosomal protein S18-alanine N-acetyltransferase [Succinivibrio sp.]|nr:ribosomal protein S18-alanine N-acetyltransferase [Succinivibrio sp.]